jgi:hypothetical protein
MTRPHPEPATCAVCDQPGARPSEGHVSPLCPEHDRAWLRSGEHARASTARGDFVRRSKAERGEQPRPKVVVEDPWSS